MSKLARTLPALKPLSTLALISSWAYHAFNEGGGTGTGTATTVANDSRATALTAATLLSAIDIQWSGRPGWYTTDGVAEGAYKLRSADAVAMDSVYSLGQGCLFLALQLSLPVSASRGCIAHIGSIDAGNTIYGLELFREATATNNKIGLLMRDDANVAVTANTSNTITQDGGAARTVTIARTSTTATVTDTAHGKTGTWYGFISGAGQAAYNGVFLMTYVDANTYTYTVAGAPATPATGTILSANMGSDINVFAVIDNRVGYKVATLYHQKTSTPNTAPEAGTPMSLATLGSLTLNGTGYSSGSPPASGAAPGVFIGRNGRSGTYEFCGMQLRRMLPVNFGQNVPANLASEIIPELHRRMCVPGWKLNGL